MVSDEPAILSNGFSFKFDVKKHGSFGYVCPGVSIIFWTVLLSESAVLSEWVDPSVWNHRMPHSKEQWITDASYGTSIWLPQQQPPLADRISEKTDAITLLFLRQIRKVCIEEYGATRELTLQSTPFQCDADDIRMARCSLHESCVLSSGSVPVGEDSSFVVIRKQFAKPTEFGSGHTEVAIAFATKSEPRSFHFYTFLPVNNVGFPFAIHAEMVLVSSRQQVQCDSPWNLWLRDCIPSVFQQAIESCDELQGLLAMYGSHLEVADPFWKPAAEAILDVIRKTAFVRTESGGFKSPLQVLVRTDNGIITNHELLAACGKEFVHADMVAELGCDVAKKLGCEEFDLAHMVTVLKHRESGDKLHGDDPGQAFKEWPVEKLDTMYCFLHRTMDAVPDAVEQIWDLNLFPIQPSRTVDTRRVLPKCFEGYGPNASNASSDTVRAVTSLESGTIFLSMPTQWRDALQTGCIRVLDMKSDDLSEGANEFIRSCGIREATLEAVVDSILVQHTNGTFQNEDECWYGLEFIREHYAAIDIQKRHLLGGTLCAPRLDGTLVSICKLAACSVLGVACSCYDKKIPAMPLDIGDMDVCSTSLDLVIRKGPRASLFEWEAFCVALGAKTHLDVCTCPNVWKDLSSSEDACSICLNSLSALDQRSGLGCGHCFHTECISKWCQKHDTCPLCRERVEKLERCTPSKGAEQLSASLSHAVRELLGAAKESQTLILQAALDVYARGSTKSIIAGTIVEAECGADELGNCFLSSAFPVIGKGLLPVISMDMDRQGAESADIIKLLASFGVSTTDTIDDLLKALVVAMQHAIDQTPPGHTIIAGLSSIVTALNGRLSSMKPGSEHNAVVEKVATQLSEHRRAFAFAHRLANVSNAKPPQDVMWDGDTTVAKLINVELIQPVYGAAMKSFFTLAGLRCIEPTDCWNALQTLKSDQAQLPTSKCRREASICYQALERLGQSQGWAAVVPPKNSTFLYTILTSPGRASHPLLKCCKSAHSLTAENFRTAAICINDDQFAYRCFDQSLICLDEGAFEKAPGLLQALERAGAVVRLSKLQRTEGEMDYARPTQVVSSWTMWCREFISTKSKEFQSVMPLEEVCQLVDKLEVIQTPALTLSTTLTGHFSSHQHPPVNITFPACRHKYQCYGKGHQILLTQAYLKNERKACWTIGQRLSSLLSSFWSRWDDHVLGWTAYEFLMGKCGLAQEVRAFSRAASRTADGDKVVWYDKSHGPAACTVPLKNMSDIVPSEAPTKLTPQIQDVPLEQENQHPKLPENLHADKARLDVSNGNEENTDVRQDETTKQSTNAGKEGNTDVRQDETTNQSTNAGNEDGAAPHGSKVAELVDLLIKVTQEEYQQGEFSGMETRLRQRFKLAIASHCHLDETNRNNSTVPPRALNSRVTRAARRAQQGNSKNNPISLD